MAWACQTTSSHHRFASLPTVGKQNRQLLSSFSRPATLSGCERSSRGIQSRLVPAAVPCEACGAEEKSLTKAAVGAPAIVPSSATQLPHQQQQATRVVLLSIDPDTHGAVVVASWEANGPADAPPQPSQLEDVHIYDMPCALVTLKQVHKKGKQAGKHKQRRWLDVAAARRLVAQILRQYGVTDEPGSQACANGHTGSVSLAHSSLSVTMNGLASMYNGHHSALSINGSSDTVALSTSSSSPCCSGSVSAASLLHTAPQPKPHVELWAYVETPPIMPFTSRPGTVSTQMYSVGAWQGILTMAGFNACTVPAGRWKRDLKLTGMDKTASAALAIQLFPRMKSMLTLKKDHGRAEALLIAAWALGCTSTAWDWQEADTGGTGATSNVKKATTGSKKHSNTAAVSGGQQGGVSASSSTHLAGQVPPHPDLAGSESEDGEEMWDKAAAGKKGLLGLEPGMQITWEVQQGPLRRPVATDGYGNPMPDTNAQQLQEVTARIPKTKKLKSTKPKGTRKAKAKANPESTQPPAPNAPAAAESGQPTAPVSLQAPSPPSPAELSATAEAMAAGAQLSRGQSELVLVPPHMPLPARSGGDTSQPASPASLPPPPQQQGGQARLSPTGDRHQQQQRKRTPGWEDALMLKEQQLECQQQHQQESRSSPGIAVTRSTSPGDTSRRSHSPSPAAAGSLTGSPSGSGNSAVSYSIKSSKEKPASKRNKRLCSGT